MKQCATKVKIGHLYGTHYKILILTKIKSLANTMLARLLLSDPGSRY